MRALSPNFVVSLKAAQDAARLHGEFNAIHRTEVFKVNLWVAGTAFDHEVLRRGRREQLTDLLARVRREAARGDEPIAIRPPCAKIMTRASSAPESRRSTQSAPAPSAFLLDRRSALPAPGDPAPDSRRIVPRRSRLMVSPPGLRPRPAPQTNQAYPSLANKVRSTDRTVRGCRPCSPSEYPTYTTVCALTL